MDNSSENSFNSEISHSSELSYSNPTRTPITAKDIITSYGAIYKTTGGSDNKLGGLYLKSFLNKLVSNRVLDLYLKYLGIKMLTTASLVPISLIMGQDLFEKSINYIVSSDQKGGNFLENKIPLLDDVVCGRCSALWKDIASYKNSAQRCCPGSSESWCGAPFLKASNTA